MELLLFLNVKSKNAVKLACKTHENLFNRAAFFSFAEKLESWLERLNTPLRCGFSTISRINEHIKMYL